MVRSHYVGKEIGMDRMGTRQEGIDHVTGTRLGGRGRFGGGWLGKMEEG